MNTYKVTSPSLGDYEVMAKNKAKARKEILKKEEIQLRKKDDESSGSFIFLEQVDDRWDDVKIGNTPYEVGDWGCLITSLSMLSLWYEDFKDPEWIAKNLEYRSDGALYWTSMNGKLPMDFVYRYYSRDIDKIKSIIDSKDNACVVRVPYGKYSHWLTAIGYDDVGIIAADPMDGTRCYPEKKYGKINGAGEVTRSKTN